MLTAPSLNYKLYLSLQHINTSKVHCPHGIKNGKILLAATVSKDNVALIPV